MTLALRQTDVVLDDKGRPVVNGYFYVGTYGTDPVSNPLSLYSDAALTTPIANPQRTDSYGRPESDIYIAFSRYSYQIKNSAGTTIEGPKDRVPFGNASQVALDQGGSVQDAIKYVTPQMFGALGNGSDQTSHFQSAAQAATAYVTLTGSPASIARAPFCAVYVPAGDYTLTAAVDSDGSDVVWLLDPAAKITGINYLPNRIGILHKRITADTYGTEDYACGFAVMANVSKATNARILSMTSAQKLSTYGSRDSVGFYVENTHKGPLHTVAGAGTTYTATGASFTTPIDTKGLRVGMIVDTRHATKYSGFLTAWTTTSITVSAWYPVDGSEIAGTPADGTGFYVSPITKAWASNINLFIEEASLPGPSGIREATGVEAGLFDSSTTGSQPLSVMFDVANIGSREGKFGFWVRGTSSSGTYGWESGYVSWRHSLAAFKAQYGKAGSNNFHSIGQGEASAGAFTNAGYYDYKSTVSFMAQPASGGNAYLARAPDGAINRFQVADTGQVSVRSTSTRAFSVRSQDDAVEYFGVSDRGRIGPMCRRITTVSAASYTTVGGDYVLVCVPGAGTINLLDATINQGREFEVVNRSGGGVTVDPSGAQTVDGAATVVVANGTNARFLSDGSNWLQLT